MNYICHMSIYIYYLTVLHTCYNHIFFIIYIYIWIVIHVYQYIASYSVYIYVLQALHLQTYVDEQIHSPNKHLLQVWYLWHTVFFSKYGAGKKISLVCPACFLDLLEGANSNKLSSLLGNIPVFLQWRSYISWQNLGPGPKGLTFGRLHLKPYLISKGQRSFLVTNLRLAMDF